jgi:hypothetical protein
MTRYIFRFILTSACIAGFTQASSACVFGGKDPVSCIEKCSQSPTEIGVPTCIVGSTMHGANR